MCAIVKTAFSHVVWEFYNMWFRFVRYVEWGGCFLGWAFAWRSTCQNDSSFWKGALVSSVFFFFFLFFFFFFFFFFLLLLLLLLRYFTDAMATSVATSPWNLEFITLFPRPLRPCLEPAESTPHSVTVIYTYGIIIVIALIAAAVTFGNFIPGRKVRAREILTCALRFTRARAHARTRTEVGRTRVLCWYDFIDASISIFFLFQSKERFMVAFQPKALFILTLLLW